MLKSEYIDIIVFCFIMIVVEWQIRVMAKRVKKLKYDADNFGKILKTDTYINRKLKQQQKGELK